MTFGILMYHHIAPPPGDPAPDLFVSPAAFDAQLRWLREWGFEIATLEAIGERLRGGRPLPRRAAAITFDDGFQDNFEEALPTLKKFGATATFFITTSDIGGTLNGHPCMTVEQLQDVVRAGMSIGSHAATHRRLARLPLEEARGELIDSKRTLESIAGKPVTWLAYPYGSFNRAIVAEAKKAGYAGACSVIRDNSPKPRQLFWLPRTMPRNNTSPMRFRYSFTPLYHGLHGWKNRKRWGKYL